MTFTVALRRIRSTGGPTVKGLTPRATLIWSGFWEWSRGFWEGLLVEEIVNDDPTAHFTPREWADLPVHHPRSPE